MNAFRSATLALCVLAAAMVSPTVHAGIQTYVPVPVVSGGMGLTAGTGFGYGTGGFGGLGLGGSGGGLFGLIFFRKCLFSLSFR